MATIQKKIFSILFGCYLTIIAFFPLISARGQDPVAFKVGTKPESINANIPFSSEFFPQEGWRVYVKPSALWTDITKISLAISIPDNAPTNLQVLVHLKDWDYFWYQYLAPNYLKPGKTNVIEVNMSPDNNRWTASGHQGRWHFRCLMEPAEVGITVFGAPEWKGICSLESLTGTPAVADKSPPNITDLTVNSNQLPVYSKFEASFKLPDRYPDPFDQNQIRVIGEFIAPSGKKIKVDGFYGQEYYRYPSVSKDRVRPQGLPFWRVRFTPEEKGLYTFTVSATDANGSADWGPAEFMASAPVSPGFVRVSPRDKRFFETSDGNFFFPIGHNIRSPFDSRMDVNFPWKKRWPEGSTAYVRYFKEMKMAGENIAEVWSASWSLGLEWISSWYGYHGIGQYNMINAWETDKVFELAEQNGIRINFVIHNHGKYSAFSDQEWEHNPFFIKNGGYLEKPEEIFTDERARKDFLKLFRYMNARWGYSPNLFAWQLWSELDLVGSKHGQHIHKRPETTEWHKFMGGIIKDLDPYSHMVSTHTCENYTHQSEDIISLPEMDLCPVDAYHYSQNPLHIITLLKNTADYNNKFNKPVLPTEFGGDPQAQTLSFLRNTLHPALWTSACIPMGGAPLFWWWQIIEEEDLYPVFSAFERFMRGEDKRDISVVSVSPVIKQKMLDPSLFSIVCSASDSKAIGWVYYTGSSWLEELPIRATADDLQVTFDNMADSTYTVEFWDTSEGKCALSKNVLCENGSLQIEFPQFTRDIAFKVKQNPETR